MKNWLIRVAGTCTSISLKPTIPSITWPTENNQPSTSANSDKSSAHAPNTSKRRESALRDEQRRTTPRDEYGDDMLDDEDLVAVMDSVEDASFRHTDSFEAAKPTRAAPKIVLPRHFNPPVSDAPEEPQELWQPKRLSNGKWDCNHKCKDKQECKHYCCNHGLDNPPKEPGRAKKAKNDGEGFASQAKQKLSRGQTTLNIRKAGKRHDLPSMDDDVELMDLSRPKSKAKAPSAPKADEYKKLAKLHSATQKSTTSAPMPRFTLPSLGPPSGRQGSQRLSFLPDHRQQQEMEHEANDFGLDLSDSELPDDPIQSTARYKDDAAMVAELTGAKRAPSLPQYEKTSTSYGFGDSDGSVEAAMVGLADSQAMRSHRAENADDIEPSVLHTSYTTAKGVPPGIEKSMKSTGAKAPFFASSRDPEVPSKPVCASASKHEGSPFDANALPKLKKPRQDVASISEGAKAAETPNTTEDKSSDPPSEIDPMIMQMFGSYVNFV
jgi:ATP-dependent DNA helicase HFM1/MER3